ncbi:MAG TPA: chemotaxis protein CheC [Longimicrobiaceae bacterium]|nr:chemotaxis protein CheC [Longimicrobiaceae bacterium]
MKESGVHPRQIDAIREVINIGAGHAATALSTMTNVTVMISVPRILWSDRPDGAEPALPDDERLVMVSVPVQSESTGHGERASLIIGRRTAMRMVGLLLRRSIDPDGEFGALERSTLQELGNIVCASYVGVLGTFLGESVMIGTPDLREGPRGEMAHEVGSGLMIETDFTLQNSTFEGVFVLTHTEISFASLLAALGLSNPA